MWITCRRIRQYRLCTKIQSKRSNRGFRFVIHGRHLVDRTVQYRQEWAAENSQINRFRFGLMFWFWWKRLGAQRHKAAETKWKVSVDKIPVWTSSWLWLEDDTQFCLVAGWRSKYWYWSVLKKWNCVDTPVPAVVSCSLFFLTAHWHTC